MGQWVVVEIIEMGLEKDNEDNLFIFKSDFLIYFQYFYYS